MPIHRQLSISHLTIGLHQIKKGLLTHGSRTVRTGLASVLLQNVHTVLMAGVDCIVQRTIAPSIMQIHIGTGLAKDLDHLGPTIAGRQMQGGTFVVISMIQIHVAKFQ